MACTAALSPAKLIWSKDISLGVHCRRHPKDCHHQTLSIMEYLIKGSAPALDKIEGLVGKVFYISDPNVIMSCLTCSALSV
jgi:hypothetical protein